MSKKISNIKWIAILRSEDICDNEIEVGEYNHERKENNCKKKEDI